MNLNFGRYTVKTSNEDKILFPEEEITKMDLLNYYMKMADHILPYTKDRPLTMHRFPDGLDGDNFYQKEASNYFPDWIDTVQVKKEKGAVNMVLINKKATLAYLVNQACITPHIWLSKKNKIDFPDKMVFDLDPPKDGFELVIKGAKDLRNLLENELGLTTFVMTTGSKGLHLIVPIKRETKFDKVRDFAAGISKFVASNDNDNYTTEVRKDKRNGRLFIDYLRNSYAQTSVTPYAVRAIKGAPVAAPLAWNELDEEMLSAQKYNITNLSENIEKQQDPWENYFKTGKSLNEPIRKLKSLTDS